MAAWPDYAADLVKLPYAADLTVRDFAALMILVPGEHAGRPAIESAVGDQAADIAISALAGHGLVKEEPKGIILTSRGKELVERFVDIRASAAERILDTLPDQMQTQVIQAWEALADAVQRSEALEKV